MKTNLTFKQFSSALLDGHILEHIVHKICIYLNPEGHIAFTESNNLLAPGLDLDPANWQKYAEPKWQDSIPKQGRMCWVSDHNPHEKGYLQVICAYQPITSPNQPFKSASKQPWKYATPVTEEEFKHYNGAQPDE